MNAVCRTAEEREPLLEARRLSRRFHPGTAREVRAVESVSLAIATGSCVALAGPSGSGKTTLLGMLGLLDRPTSGELRWHGRPLHDGGDYQLARTRRRIGFVFQNFSLLPRLSIVDNIGYPLIPRGLDRQARLAAAQRWLTRLGLAEHADRPVEELSGGECQRVAIARALAGDPELVLADEPTSNLDDQTSQTVIEIVRELQASGKTVILATHDPRLLALATQVYALRGGEIVASE